MIVVKFGGTSVKDATAMKNVCEIVRQKDRKVVVLVSAMTTVTNSLVEINQNLDNKDFVSEKSKQLKDKHLTAASELGILELASNFINNEIDEILEISNSNYSKSKIQDAILAKGEVLSSYLISTYAKNIGLETAHTDSRQLIKTDSNWSEANINIEFTNYLINQRIRELLAINKIVFCGGFIASNAQNETTTLGRGGSDFSAAIYASALNADMLEIWTDVDGILTADPRVVKGCKRILKLSYQEAAEMAFFGAKVLHPKTIHPAVEQQIPVYVKNTFNPDGEGTLIQDSENHPLMIKSIASRKNITIITIHSNRMLGAYGFLNKVFEIFNNHKTSVDLVTTSEVSISLTIENEDNLEKVIADLEQIGKIDVSKENAIVSLIGNGIRQVSGIAARIFGVLKGINISMVSVGASEVNLSLVLKTKDLDNALVLLHNELFANDVDESVFQEL